MKKLLDTNIIIGYTGLLTQNRNRSCYKFIKKEGGLIICSYSLEHEVSSILKRQKIIINEIKRKIDNEDYKMGYSNESLDIPKGDLNKAKKLYSILILKNKGKKTIISKLMNIINIIETRVNYFLDVVLDKVVVPIDEINGKIVGVLRNYIDNFSDCHIFASAIQYNQKENLIFITLDKKDFDKNSMAFIKEDIKLKNYNFPEISYL